jgi:hypothetical protein
MPSERKRQRYQSPNDEFNQLRVPATKQEALGLYSIPEMLKIDG